ncbi:hypothetical protein TNCT_138791 [Trichonephila clavata]|uniref:Uncharacterized protein n=1 Tax=Trichonephila clavata TaxID=2740835 RepID=A0A8X6KM10_TRICU|nr:hypothetical protein TNCT_138791 [Trichonephila clavata]
MWSPERILPSKRSPASFLQSNRQLKRRQRVRGSKVESSSRDGAVTEITTKISTRSPYPIRNRSSSRGRHLEESYTARHWTESRRQPCNLRAKQMLVTLDSVLQKKDYLYQ